MFLKLQTKLMCAVLLLMAVVLTDCMGKPAKKAPEMPYSVGVIDSSNDRTTYLYLFDENLKETDTLRCPYRGVGSFSHTPMQMEGGVVYEQWAGSTIHPNKCAVAAMDLETGEWKDYSFEGVGSINDFRVNEHGIFALSSVLDTAVDYYSFADGENTTVKVKDASGAFAVSVDGYDVYFIAGEMRGTAEDVEAAYLADENMEEEKTFLYHVNVKEQSQEKLLDVTKELGENVLDYTQWYEGKMYIPNNKYLCVYDPEKNKLYQIPLPCKGEDEEAYQIHVDAAKLYIVAGDYRNDGETDIYQFNPETEEIELSYHVEEAVMQSCVKDGIFYLLQQEPAKVCKYEFLQDGSCRKLAEADVDAETDSGHMISDMFVK